jgi:hypothetical protein
MPSSLVSGPLDKLIRIAQELTIKATARLLIEPKANPATCTKGELNVATDGKLYICSATNTWTVVGSQS